MRADSGVEHHVREWAADADEAQALCQLFVADREGDFSLDLVHLVVFVHLP